MEEKVLITMTEEEFREIIRKEVEAAVAHLRTEKDLPYYLTRTEVKNLLRISDTKVSELLGRPDFPVCREIGLKIPRDKLFKWINDRTPGVDI